MQGKAKPDTESGSAPLRCSANFKHEGSDEAVSLLLVSVRDKKCFVAYPRCAAHPAETYLRLVGIIHPAEVSLVIPLLKQTDLDLLIEGV